MSDSQSTDKRLDTDKRSDDVVLDLSRIKNKFKGFFSKEHNSPKESHSSSPHGHTHEQTHGHTHEQGQTSHHHQHQDHKPEDTISFDAKKVKELAKKHARWIIPLLCILIAISFSVYLRTMPERLPITDSWAEGSVRNFYHDQINAKITQQYPNLPEQNKNAVIDKEWQKFIAENEELLTAQTAELSRQYKNHFHDDAGTLYLLGIDPYHYYRQSYNVLTYGHPGTEIKDGEYIDTYRLAPRGDAAEWNFHNWFGAMLHRLVSLFSDAPLMATFFFVGTIFAGLTVIPAFFIGKIITKNNVGGFFTAMLLAVSGFFVSRTTGESSDTDVYAVFFPVLITWLFLQALDAKTLKKKLLWISAAGFGTGLFAFAWTGWWYTSVFILATIAIYIVYIIALYRQAALKPFSAVLKDHLALAGTYIITSGVFVSLFTSFWQFRRVILGPFQFLKLKAVGVDTFWPNIRTTVAELNVVSISNVIEQLDGRLLFSLAIAGILLIFLLRKDEKNKFDLRIPFFLALWLIASIYATSKGVRFILQITPVFAIALGACMGLSWHYISRWISDSLKLQKRVAQVVIFILIALLLIQPIKSGYSQAYNSIPSMNDAWYNTLTKIKLEAPKNAIITSWWDFGHWFKAVADRPVTFDGGNQVGYDAHWVGKALLTNDEKVTVGIVRMLNCGQNNAYNTLDEIFHDVNKEITIVNEIIVQDKLQAARTLQGYGLTPEQVNKVLENTHCDAPADYFITSDDMIGKAGVWGHFGSWDFRRAVMYQKTKSLSREDAISYLTSTFNMSAEEASKIHAEILTNEADSWIASWPSYISGINRCQPQEGNKFLCVVGTRQGDVALDINLQEGNVTATVRTNSNEAVHPTALIYADKQSIKEKRFERNALPFAAVLIPVDDGNYQIMLTDPLHGYSTFTKLFFLDGHGLKCFQKFDDVQQFTGGRIITWIVDYDCKQENKVYFLPQPQVHAAHLMISTQGRTEQEALAMITSIKENITATNFREYALRYSEDPGSKGQGGDLGWFGKGAMVPEFEDAAFSLPINAISEPIKTQYGYHLIQVLEKKEE